MTNKEEAIKAITSLINRIESIKPRVKKSLVTTVADIISEISVEAAPSDQNRPFMNSVKPIRDGVQPGHTVVMTESMSSKADDFAKARIAKETKESKEAKAKTTVKNPVNKW